MHCSAPHTPSQARHVRHAEPSLQQFSRMYMIAAYLELEDYPQEHPQETGELEPEIVPGQYTKTGAPKEVG